MKRFMTIMITAAVPLAIAASSAANADTYRTGKQDLNSTVSADNAPMMGVPVGDVSRPTESAGYADPVNDVPYGGFTPVLRDTEKEGLYK